MTPHPVQIFFFSLVENRTWLDHLLLAVFLGRNKSSAKIKCDQVLGTKSDGMDTEDQVEGRLGSAKGSELSVCH
jgi:hypothetical protein